MLNKFWYNTFLLVVAGLTVWGTLQVVAAPSSPPPGSSLDLPLTQGNRSEIKTGPLTIQNQLAVNQLCIGGTGSDQCKTTWPTATIKASSQSLSGQAQSTTCYSNNYQSISYYSASSCYSGPDSCQYNLVTAQVRACRTNFAITMPLSGAGVPISVYGQEAKCFLPSCSSNYNWWGYSQSTCYPSSSYVTAQSLNVNIGDSNVTLSGYCDIFDVNNNNSSVNIYSQVTAKVTVRLIQ